MSKVQEKRTKLRDVSEQHRHGDGRGRGCFPFAAFTYELPGVASGQTIILVGVSLVLMTRGEGYERRRDGRP